MRAIDKFHYVPNEDVEDICLYEPGGYHPVKLGDTFPGQGGSKYRVIHKLGSGSFATIWLAKGLPKGHYVALKVLTEDAAANGNEAQLLRWLGGQSTNHPGYHHIAHLLDSFQIQGPNGTHDVLVMEPMVSLFWLQREASDIISSHAKSFVHQMVDGLSYLHSLQVMHGDLHLSNIALALPDLDKYSESELLLPFNDPETTIVLPLRLEDQTDSLPPYVISPICLAELVLKQLRSSASNNLYVKIIDFGNAFRQGDPKPPPHSPPYIRAPEIEIWQRSNGNVVSDWGIKGDIWSLGCTVFEMIWHSIFFYTWGDGGFLLSEVAKYGGPLPSPWLAYLDSKYVEGASRPTLDEDWEARRKQISNYPPKDISQPLWEENTHLLISLLRDMIKTEPQCRRSAEEFLHHPWFGIAGLTRLDGEL